jgi:hypothetical protein
MRVSCALADGLTKMLPFTSVMRPIRSVGAHRAPAADAIVWAAALSSQTAQAIAAMAKPCTELRNRTSDADQKL